MGQHGGPPTRSPRPTERSAVETASPVVATSTAAARAVTAASGGPRPRPTLPPARFRGCAPLWGTWSTPPDDTVAARLVCSPRVGRPVIMPVGISVRRGVIAGQVPAPALERAVRPSVRRRRTTTLSQVPAGAAARILLPRRTTWCSGATYSSRGAARPAASTAGAGAAASTGACRGPAPSTVLR